MTRQSYKTIKDALYIQIFTAICGLVQGFNALFNSSCVVGRPLYCRVRSNSGNAKFEWLIPFKTRNAEITDYHACIHSNSLEIVA